MAVFRETPFRGESDKAAATGNYSYDRIAGEIVDYRQLVLHATIFW